MVMQRQAHGRRFPRPLWLLVLSLLALAAPWQTAWAQPALQEVATDLGVTVAVPAGLRRAPGLAALPDTPVQVEGLATFTDDGDRPLSIQIRRGEAHGWESLPAAHPGVAAEWTQRFAAELQLPEAYDFTPGRYEPERGALSLQYKVKGPSSARLMQRLPDEHPLWAATIAAGESPAIAKCVLGALLVGQSSASEAELRARIGITAAVCGLPEALVSEYLQQLGVAEFAPSVTTVTYLSFFTQQGTIGALIMAPLDRQQAVDEAAALVWRETELAASVRLPVSAGSDPYRLALLAGIVIGSLLGVLVLGGGLSWLLVRLGVRATLAVASTLGLLCALAAVGWLRVGGGQLEGGLQLVSYLLASALAFRPLVRWLSSRGGSPRRARSVRGSRGLTTVEYVVVLVLLACVSIGAWRLFGGSVQKALSNSTEQLDGLAKIPLGDGARNPSASSGPTPGGNRSDDNRGSTPSTGARGGNARGADTPGADAKGGNARAGDRRSAGAGPARQSPGGGNGSPGSVRGGASDAAAGRTAARDSGSAARPASESRGSPAQGAAAGALQGVLPGRVLTPPPAPLPANAGRVLAGEAKEPSLLLRGADVATDFVPYLSNVKDATIAITGVNPITKEHVGTFGRVVAGVFAIPAAGNVLKYVGKGGKYVLAGGKAAYEAGKAAKLGTRIAGVLGREAEKEIAEQGAERLVKQAEKEAEKLGERAAAGGALATSRKLGTEANQAVFWSGIGADGEQVAKAWAEKNGGKTMEKIMEERGVKLPPWPKAGDVPEATEKAWRDASREFAQGASGDVRVLQQDSVGVGRVWGKEEFPALINNPKVTSITAVDPRTGAQILLWKR
jgi:Flp pilus assembly pilin Flp